MKSLAHWIRSHQISAFFIFTIVISWGLWFAPGAVYQRGQDLLAPLAIVAACGPALAGILITAVSNTEPKRGKRRTFWIAFLVAWALSTLVFLGHNILFGTTQLSPVVIALLAVSIIPVAFVVSSTFSPNLAVREYLSSLIRLRGVWKWCLLALFFIPVLILISVPVSNMLNGKPLADFPFPEFGLSLVGLIAVKFLYQFFFFNATGEEVGWRGFILPRLQARISPLLATLIIALFWAPWHFFFWQAEGKPVMTSEFWFGMFEGHILLSIFIVWICNRAGGSILVAGIAHAAANTAFAFIFLETNLVWWVAALALILVDRMWEKLPVGHPAVWRPPSIPAQQLAGVP